VQPHHKEEEMALSEINACCASCNHQFAAIPTRSFLGFQKLECPSCKAKVTYPLTKGYRITYIVIFGLMVLQIIATFSQGAIGFPGGIGIAVIIALVIDFNLRKKIAAASAAS